MLVNAKYRTLLLAGLTIVFLWLAKYISVFPHEYMHSLTAWILGYKANPFAITYGGDSLSNMLLLTNIDENVNYYLIHMIGSGWEISLIAFAGPGVAGGVLYALSLWLLKRPYVLKCIYLYYFIVMVNFINICEFFAYVPIRTLTTHGDAAHIAYGLGISPWWILLTVGCFVAYAIYHFFCSTMSSCFRLMEVEGHGLKLCLVSIYSSILFGYFALPGLIGHYGEVSHAFGLVSLFLIPAVVIIYMILQSGDRMS